jgi:predicted acyl esterase
VTASGQSFQLAAGHCLIPAPGPPAPVALSLLGTCATLTAGERLRLSIATAAFPAFPVNPGTGEDPVATPAAAAQITTLGLRLGAQTRLELAIG